MANFVFGNLFSQLVPGLTKKYLKNRISAATNLFFTFNRGGRMARGSDGTKPELNQKENPKRRKKKKSSKRQCSMELLFVKMLVEKVDFDPSDSLGLPSNVNGGARRSTKTGLDSTGNGYYQIPESQKPE